MPAVPGLILAAPGSGAGKTLATLAVLRALAERGVRAAPFKTGPDYIDPAFLAAAARRPAINLDPWAMRPASLAALAHGLAAGSDVIVGEGVMGLFDGGPGGAGSTASLAAATGWPVVLVVDAKGMAASAAALVEGFVRHRADVAVAGVLFNRAGGASHARLLAQAVAHLDVAVLGAIPRDEGVALPSRHLGLVQARELAGLEAVVARAGALAAQHVDLDRLLALARPARLPAADGIPLLPPAGQRIALADDAAFAFAYPHLVASWRAAGAEIAPFSPLADEAPATDCDAVFLPGGYPELHAGRLAASGRFLAGLRAAAARGATVWGECGGYMVLGETLVDAEGAAHRMAGLLPVATSFAERGLHLGYRALTLAADAPVGRAGAAFRGHEFHYAREIARSGPPLFRAADAGGRDLGDAGCVVGRVAGSFIHLIDRAAP